MKCTKRAADRDPRTGLHAGVGAILDVVERHFAFRDAAEAALGQPWHRLTLDALARLRQRGYTPFLAVERE